MAIVATDTITFNNSHYISVPENGKVEKKQYHFEPLCTITDSSGNVATKVVIEPKNIYFVYSGENQTWTKGDTDDLLVVFKNSNVFNDKDTYNKWKQKVTVDGKEITLLRDYTARSGSLEVSLKKSYLDSLSIGSHRMIVNFNDYDGDVIANFIVINKSSGGGSTPKKDNVVTCQMAGFPANYAWNEAAKACQPGYIDAGGNFHSYSNAKRSTVPNTSDNGNLTFYTIAMFLMTFVAYITAKKLTEDSRA